MEALNNFINWLTRLGGEVPTDTSYLKEKFIDQPRQEHSLKERAKEIKARYNYHFDKLNYLKDIPENINNLKFDKK